MALNAREIIKQHYRKQGKKGGDARSKSLTPERRAEIARGAAKARWGKERKAS